MEYTPWTRKKLDEARTNISAYTSWKKPSTLIREIQEAYTGLENYDLMLSYDDLEQGESYDRILIANVDMDSLEPYIKWGRKKAVATKKSSPSKSTLTAAECLATPDQTMNLINVIRRHPDALSGLRYYAKPSTNGGRTKYIAEELSRKLSCMVVTDRIIYNGWLPEHKHFICTYYHGIEPLRDVWNENPRPLNESIDRKTQYTPWSRVRNKNVHQPGGDLLIALYDITEEIKKELQVLNPLALKTNKCDPVKLDNLEPNRRYYVIDLDPDYEIMMNNPLIKKKKDNTAKYYEIINSLPKNSPVIFPRAYKGEDTTFPFNFCGDKGPVEVIASKAAEKLKCCLIVYRVITDENGNISFVSKPTHHYHEFGGFNPQYKRPYEVSA